jgi:hypothetical protein
MSVRQFPAALRTRVRVAYAVAWEALVESHQEQALQFIGEFASRVTPLEALELYLSVVPVSAAMHEPIRTRTLAALELDHLPSQAAAPALRGWRVLRPDLVIKLIRFRRAYHERTLELGKMVGARAAEAVSATHIRNAQAFAELLSGYYPVGRAVVEYVAAFHLALGVAQVVMQRVKAAAAGSELALEYSRPVLPDAELLEEAGGEVELSPPGPPAPRSSPSAASA